MIVAAAVPFVPDLTLVIPPLLQLGMFLSGVFYPIDWIPSRWQALFRLNPMAGLIMEYRNAMLHSQVPDIEYLACVAVISMALLGIGIWLLIHFDRVYPRLTN
jgi:lipopolysaccharide transport system permease protein